MKKKVYKTTPLPSVFSSPIRLDVVRFVFTNMNKNRRQAYAVANWAGHQTAAESWGTGRAVARIPRVPGSGTSRSGQGAFGNMCRKGRMFAPTKTWRKWHRKISKGQRRFATCSALAATSVPSLVLARGHRIEQVPEIPFVVSNEDIDGIAKTKEAVAFLKSFQLYDDIERVKESHKIRKGSGKSRNRRHVERKGPLLVYFKEDNTVPFAFRNIPGIELCHVSRLNLLQLAPGGHLGRFIIWTEDAFDKLDQIYGTFTSQSTHKKGFTLPHSIMTNTDLSRIINSDEIQSQLRPQKTQIKFTTRKKNPLRNFGALVKLNPYALTQRRRAILQSERSSEKRRKDFEKKEQEKNSSKVSLGLWLYYQRKSKKKKNSSTNLSTKIPLFMKNHLKKKLLRRNLKKERKERKVRKKARKVLKARTKKEVKMTRREVKMIRKEVKMIRKEERKVKIFSK